MAQTKWASSVLLVDADYLDTVASDLSNHFGKVLNRNIQQADLCHWIDCIALDSGLRPGKNDIQAHFLHAKGKTAFTKFIPSRFEEDINELSFDDNLGHVSLFAFPVENMVTTEEFFLQSLTMLADAAEVKNLMVIGDMRAYGKQVTNICQHTDGKEITLFTMEPLEGTGFRQEILGYSLLSALGISADDLQQ